MKIQTLKINKIQLLQMLQDKVPQTQIARNFGCTRAAVQRAIKSLKENNMSVREASDQPKAMVPRRELSSGTIDTMQQLKQMNDIILEELNRCRRFIDKEDKALREYEALEKKSKSRPTDILLQDLVKKKGVVTYSQILSLQNSVISIAGEVRKQLELQLKLAEAMYSVTMVAEFQDEVIQVLREADEKFGSNVREMVIEKLKERRSIRGLLKQVTYKKPG